MNTIRRNNVLEAMSPYSCHSTISPDRMKAKVVRHGNGSPKNEGWPAFGSTKCRYDKALKDERCVDCTHEWDFEYVANLRRTG